MAYEKLGFLIKDLREQIGLTQADLAQEVDVTQQTVSRWEKGRSRPSREIVRLLAEILGPEHYPNLLKLAGYDPDDGPPLPPVRPLLQKLPLDKLTPSDFEAFSRDFIAIRHPSAQVHRFGSQGHKQDGIDLRAQLGDGTTITYQCKRVQQFGPARVRDVVTVTELEADRHHLLLSRTASPGARKEIDRHPGWRLEDAEDISRAVRFDFDPDDARRLIDTYFPRWRADFLGEDDGGAWLTPAEFFRPSLKPGAILSHEWELVGRAEQLEAVDDFLRSDRAALIISGRGGSGKSRFLRGVVSLLESHSVPRAVRFLAPETSVRPQDIESLPKGRSVVVVDDAHDRDDLELLLGPLARSDRDVKIILASRPYGKDRLVAALRTLGFTNLDGDASLDLPDLVETDVQTLASAVLQSRGAPTDAADLIARVTRDCPLFTVIAAQLVAKGDADPRELASDETARSFLLRSFNDALLGSIGDPSEREILRETLRLIALVQPVISNSEEFTRLASEVVSQRTDRVMRQVRILEEAGVLLRRGRMLRVVPDLLGEFLVADSCADQRTGEPTGYAEVVFASASGDLAQHLILNLARLDWRITREQDVDSAVLDSIWSALTDSILGLGIFGRSAILKALTSVSYYQPRRSIQLVQTLIDNPTDQLDIDPRLVPRGSYTYDYVLDAIPQFVQGAAYHMRHVGEVADILWQLGRDRPGPLHSQPEHAVRILQDLASIQPGKPLEFTACIIERAIAWTRDEAMGNYVQSPCDVLKAAVATEGYSTESRGWTINMQPFAVRAEGVEPLRTRVVETAIGLLDHSDVRVGVKAAELLEEALRYPMGMFGRQPTDEERSSWTPQFSTTLESLANHLEETRLDPVVGDRVRRAVRWHSRNDSAIGDEARGVLARLDSDLNAQVTRALAHGWAHSAELPEEDELDYTELEARWRDIQRRVASELIADRGAAGAVDLIEERITALTNTDDRHAVSPRPFLACICETSASASEEMLRRAIAQPNGPLGALAEVPLVALWRDERDKALRFAEQLIETDDETLCAQAAAALGGAGRLHDLSGDEVALVNRLADHESFWVRLSLARGLRFADKFDKARRLTAILAIAIRGSSQVADEVLGNVGRYGDFTLNDLTSDQVRRILEQLEACHDIGEFQIATFLAALSERNPGDVVSLLRRRIDRPDSEEAGADYRPIPYSWDDSSPLQIRTSPAFAQIVRELCDYLLEPYEGWRREFWAPHLFAAVVGRVDDAVLDVLSDWAGTTDPRRLEVVSHLFREAPRSLVWTRVDWVQDMLNRASILGFDCYSSVASGLHAAVVSGGRSGKPGEPFPEDVEQRDRSYEIARSLTAGSPAHRFYTSLAKSAEASIRWSIERDEEQRPD